MLGREEQIQGQQPQVLQIDRRSAHGIVLGVGVAGKAEGGCLMRQRIGGVALLYAADGDEPGRSSTGREDLGTKVRVL